MKLENKLESQIQKMFLYNDALRRKINPEMPAQQVALLYMVALFPGLSQGEIASRMEMPEGTVSRNISKLGTKAKKVKGSISGYQYEGYGLVETRHDDIMDSRKKRVYLSKEGKQLLKDLGSILYD